MRQINASRNVRSGMSSSRSTGWAALVLLLVLGLVFFQPTLGQASGTETEHKAEADKGHEAAGGHEAPPGLIEINYTVLIQLANFIVLMLVLNSVLYRPIRGIIKQRKAKYAEFENAISGLERQLDQRTKDIDARLTEARRDGFAKKDEIKGLGLEEEKKVVGAAMGQAEVAVQKVREEIKGDVAAARTALAGQVEVFSRELAQKVLGRSF